MTGDRAISLTPAQREDFAWLGDPTLVQVVGALEAARVGAARFVGGCVRDSLFGLAPKDFDIATPLTPDEVIAAAKAAGLKSAPTGIDHGTVTMIADHQGVEVTTLRADVSTDGRRASVAFTEDWTVDASRRDFTINAIYVAPDGALYDPLGGLDDIETRAVRFIGDPRQRIREDYLRILRFFRFSARFSQSMDEAGLAACADLKDGMGQLSAERIGSEFLAILRLENAVFALRAMQGVGVLRAVRDAAPDIEALARIKAVSPHAPAPVLLAGLFGPDQTGLGAALRLSNAERAQRSRALQAAQTIDPDMAGDAARAAIYRHGRETFLDGAALAFGQGRIGEATCRRLRDAAAGWTAPAFPLSGKDVLDEGVSPGPAVARLLAETETRWIDEGFPASPRARALLKAVISDNSV